MSQQTSQRTKGNQTNRYKINQSVADRVSAVYTTLRYFYDASLKQRVFYSIRYVQKLLRAHHFYFSCTNKAAEKRGAGQQASSLVSLVRGDSEIPAALPSLLMQNNFSLPSKEKQQSDANSYATNTNLTYAMLFHRLSSKLPVKFRTIICHCHYILTANKVIFFVCIVHLVQFITRPTNAQHNYILIYFTYRKYSCMFRCTLFLLLC